MRFRTTPSYLALIGLLLGASAALAQDATSEPTAGATLATIEPGPDVITLALPSMMPEGIEYDAAHDRFLVGSLIFSTIYSFDTAGTLTPFAEGGHLTGLSVVGLQIDAPRNRLLADVTNQADVGALAVFDLDTGEELMWVDLTSALPDAESYFPNDLTVDDDGNAYVSDSANGVFYKVDPDGNASLFLADDSFVGSLILNGLAFHPDGYLIAVRTPGLIKIPLDDPASFTDVQIDHELSGGDGATFAPDGTLAVVSGSQNRVFRVESSDEWATGHISGEFVTEPVYPTTVAVRGDELYVVHADFVNSLAESYPVLKVVFTDMGT